MAVSTLQPSLFIDDLVTVVIKQQALRTKALPAPTSVLPHRRKIQVSGKASYRSTPVEPRRAAGYDDGSQIASWRALCENGQLGEVVEALDSVVQQSSWLHNSVFYCVLKTCIAQKDLVLGRRVHALSVKSGYESDAFLANHFICMYSSLGNLPEAMHVFAKVAAPDRYMWASIILVHARHGRPLEAINLYRQMRGSAVKPDNHVFAAVLRACAGAEDLFSGREVHADIMAGAAKPNVFLGNCLVDMYVKCRCLEDARKVFESLPTRDVVTWNTMMAGYVKLGLGLDALALYDTMQLEGISAPADAITFACLLQACASIGALHQGKLLHAQIWRTGLDEDVVLSTCLVDMYAKCGSLEDARKVFDSLQSRDVVTWTAMIAGYAQHGYCQEALDLYGSMQQEGISPANAVTFACLLRACSSIGAVHQGNLLHAEIEKRGLEADVLVGNALVDMYAKCGSLHKAGRVFDQLPTKNVVTWTAMINGYAEHSDGAMAIQYFEKMLQQGVQPDETAFICLLVACSHAGLVQEGRQYFRLMTEDHGIAPTVNHYNCMIDLLGRSGGLDEAEKILQTMPFQKNAVGWKSLLSACKNHGDLDRGRRCFDCLIELEPENSASYVLLTNMYANAGRWRDVDKIDNLRRSAGAWKKPGKACIEVKNKVHDFVVGEERYDTSSRLRSINQRLKADGGHVPQTELVVKAVSEREKEDALCGHAEKLALAYGLMNTPDGTTLLVTKNLRMCSDCHSSTKIMSSLEKRRIIVRDAHRVHHFLDGSCSCRDRH